MQSPAMTFTISAWNREDSEPDWLDLHFCSDLYCGAPTLNEQNGRRSSS